MQHDPSKLNTTREVVTALGGTKAVAGLTGRKYAAVSNWLLEPKSRMGKRGPLKPTGGQFPPDTFVVINTALAAVGKSAPPALWGMKSVEEAAA